MNRRDIDLDDYFRSKPLASDEELSALANKIKVEYALLKNWYLGKHGIKQVSQSSFLKQVAVLVFLAMSQKQKYTTSEAVPTAIETNSLSLPRRSRRKNTATEEAQSASRVNLDNEEMDPEESGSGTMTIMIMKLK